MAERHGSEQNGFADRVIELDAIDPATRDGLYWSRFHRDVMQRAGAELARRRELMEVTISDALSGWARMVVPVAAVAAAMAGVLLVQSGDSGSSQVVIDDILDVPSSLVEDPEIEIAPTFGALAVAENF
jgi:hypothetical protein